MVPTPSDTHPGARGKSPIRRGVQKLLVALQHVFVVDRLDTWPTTARCQRAEPRSAKQPQQKALLTTPNMAMWSLQILEAKNDMTVPCWTQEQVHFFLAMALSCATCSSSRRPTTTSPRSSSCDANEPSFSEVMPVWTAPGLSAYLFTLAASMATFRCTCCLARRLCCLDVPSWKPWDWFWIAAVGWSSWMTPHGKMQLWVLTVNTWSPSSMSTTATCGNFLLPLNSWSRPMVASVAISWTLELSTKRPSSSTTSPMCSQQHRMDFVRPSAMCCRRATSLSTPWRTSFTPMSQRSSINHLESDCSGKSTAVVRGCLHLQNQWAWTLRSSATRLAGTSTLKSTR